MRVRAPAPECKRVKQQKPDGSARETQRQAHPPPDTAAAVTTTAATTTAVVPDEQLEHAVAATLTARAGRALPASTATTLPAALPLPLPPRT